MVGIRLVRSLMLLFSFWFAPFAPTDPARCDPIHALVGGELVAWMGYPQGWDLPGDLTKGKRIDFQRGGVWDRYSPSERAHYIWVFTSYERTRDAQGNHFGAHQFCGPYRIRDEG